MGLFITLSKRIPYSQKSHLMRFTGLYEVVYCKPYAPCYAKSGEAEPFLPVIFL